MGLILTMCLIFPKKIRIWALTASFAVSDQFLESWSREEVLF